MPDDETVILHRRCLAPNAPRNCHQIRNGEKGGFINPVKLIEVTLTDFDGGKNGKMAFLSRPTHQDQTIGRLRRENHYSGGEIWV